MKLRKGKKEKIFGSNPTEDHFVKFKPLMDRIIQVNIGTICVTPYISKNILSVTQTTKYFEKQEVKLVKKSLFRKLKMISKLIGMMLTHQMLSAYSRLVRLNEVKLGQI